MMTMRAVFLVLLFKLAILTRIVSLKGFNVYMKENGKYIFVRHNQIVHDVPDLETIEELGFDNKSVAKIGNDVVASFKVGSPIHSLKPVTNSPDEKMELRIEKILAYDPAEYWTESHYIAGNDKILRSYNPSISKLHNGKIVYCWRSPTDPSIIYFGWYNMNNHTITPDPRIKIDNSVLYQGQRSPMQEDARIIQLNEKTIFVTYCGVLGGLIVGQMYATGTYDEATNMIDFRRDSSKMFKFPENQKNWTPFIYKNELHLFHSLNPVHVVKSGGPDPSIDAHNSNIDSVKIVSKLHKEHHLSWDGKLYGEHFRGGTPAVMLRGKLFALFHTQLAFVGKMLTYFMGAITFCPEYPFQIHSVSRVPIVQKKLYEGPWDTGGINYCLYPMGVVIENSTEKHIYVSMGWQDVHAYVIKLEVDGLFASMDIVNHCNATVAHDV